MGASKRAVRGRSWRLQRDVVYRVFDRVREEISALLSNRKWRAAADLYVRRLHIILARIKVGSESWIISLWHRICKQYDSTDVACICEAMTRILQCEGSSCVYHLFTFSQNKPYFGIVEDRPASKRLQEHWQELCSSEPSEQKYRGMQKQARPHEWFFIPVIPATCVVALTELKLIEQGEVHAHPNCWNVVRYSRSSEKIQYVTARAEERAAVRKEGRPPMVRCVSMDCYTIGRSCKLEVQASASDLFYVVE